MNHNEKTFLELVYRTYCYKQGDKDLLSVEIDRLEDAEKALKEDSLFNSLYLSLLYFARGLDEEVVSFERFK